MSDFNLLFELSLARNCFKILILSFVISANGSSLITLNVSLREVCIFLTFVPGIAMQISSSKFLWPINATSAMSEIAYFAAQIKFSAASVLPLSIERCEYVSAIGLFSFGKKNDNAAAV